MKHHKDNKPEIEKEIPPARIKRNRRDQIACPFCNSRIPKTSKGGRRKKTCDHCKGAIEKNLISACCKGSVWRKGTEFICFTCGKEMTAEGKLDYR